jgi:hypothetical protein
VRREGSEQQEPWQVELEACGGMWRHEALWWGACVQGDASGCHVMVRLWPSQAACVLARRGLLQLKSKESSLTMRQ